MVLFGKLGFELHCIFKHLLQIKAEITGNVWVKKKRCVLASVLVVIRHKVACFCIFFFVVVSCKKARGKSPSWTCENSDFQNAKTLRFC